jgi:hypothetical protein
MMFSLTDILESLRIITRNQDLCALFCHLIRLRVYFCLQLVQLEKETDKDMCTRAVDLIG